MKKNRLKKNNSKKPVLINIPDEPVFLSKNNKDHHHIKRKSNYILKIAILLILTILAPLIVSYGDINITKTLKPEKKKHLKSKKITKIIKQDNSNASIDYDEKRKNEILMSKITDFDAPEKSGVLNLKIYKVQKGDSISSIAAKFGVSMGTIYGSNKIRPGRILHIGVALKIPNRDGIIYTMKKGDRLLSLAKKYSTDVKKILTQNSFTNPDFIPVGRKIFIPDAKTRVVVPGFTWPTYSRRITSRFGWRRNPFNKRRKEFHKGLDIKARYTWIKSTKYGKVTYAGWMRGYGNVVIVAHPGGWKSLYGHLSRRIVRKGQYVKQGQILARSGNTGRSTGPHLHFEIIKNGKHRNPLYILRKLGKRYRYL